MCGWVGTQEEALEVWNDDATEIDDYFCWDCGGDFLVQIPFDEEVTHAQSEC